MNQSPGKLEKLAGTLKKVSMKINFYVISRQLYNQEIKYGKPTISSLLNLAQKSARLKTQFKGYNPKTF